MYNDIGEVHADGGNLGKIVQNAKQRVVKPATEGPQTAQFPAQDLPAIVSSRDFIATAVERPAVLIEGLLHQGSKMILGGGSKSFKTWVLVDMALSVAGGARWWGVKTTAGKVLYINLEIQDAFFHERLLAIKAAKELNDTVWDNLDLLNLRGHCAPFKSLRDRVIAAAGTKYSLIIIDPLYKVLGGHDENSAGDIGELLNEFERVAVKTGAAVAYGHHFSKGNQAGKESIDRMSGSGVFARDADTLLVMTKHKDEDAYVIEATLRNFKPLSPFCVKWSRPLMIRNEALDPNDLKKVKGQGTKYVMADLLKVLGTQQLIRAELERQFRAKTGASEGTFNNLFRQAKDECIEKCEDGKKWKAIQPIYPTGHSFIKDSAKTVQ